MRPEPAEIAAFVQQVLAHGVPLDRAVILHDLDRVRARIGELETAFAPGTLHAVAIKANPLVEVLRACVDAGAGLEAASWEEVALARAAGCAPGRIVYDSPAKTRAELAAALADGVWINADSAEELARLDAIGVPTGARIGLRVNPELGEGRIAATSTVGRGGRFGVPLTDVPALVARFPWLVGLHVHAGSQGVSLALIEGAVRAVADAARAAGLSHLDVGGGIPVRYTAADPEPPTYAAWGAAVARASAGLSLITEPGRSVHAAAGLVVARVEAVKQVGDRPVVVIHAGADLFLRWVYASASWDHDVLLLDPDGVPRGGPSRPHDLVGPLCFSGDVLARGRELPTARPGDLLVVRDAGAYTLSMWSRHCSRGLPPVWGRDGGRLRPLHAGERPEDVVAHWSLR